MTQSPEKRLVTEASLPVLTDEALPSLIPGLAPDIFAAIEGDVTANKRALDEVDIVDPASALSIGVDAKIATVPTTRIIPHGWDATAARGSTSGNVMWVGWIQPNNLIEGQDVWLKPTETPEPTFALGEVLPLAVWRASDLAGEPGDTITSWVSGSTAAQELTGTATLREGSDGQRYVSFNGTSDMLSAAVPRAVNNHHLVVIGRLTNNIEGVSGYLISGNAASANFNIAKTVATTPDQFVAAATTNLSAGIDTDSDYHWFRASFAGASSTFDVDGTVVTGNTGTGTQQTVRLGHTLQSSGLYTAIEIKAIAIYESGVGATPELLAELRTVAMAYYGLGDA